MSPTELAARVRRFIPLAAGSVRRDLQVVARAVKELARQVPTSIETAWARSDPVGWRKRMEALIAASPEFAVAREQEKQRLAHARKRFLAHGASFAGTLHARGVSRGMILADGDSKHDLDDWLADHLGLDIYLGDDLLVRIVIEPLDSPHALKARIG